MQELSELQRTAHDAIARAETLSMLEVIRVDYLGKKGRLTELLKGLAGLTAEEKPLVGQQVNQAKRDIMARIDEKKIELKEHELETKIASEHLDVTLPGRNTQAGTLHPVTQVKERIVGYFSKLGFDVISGPEIETDFYNFEALNIPAHHPARAMHDTFYFGDGRLLRTHTSPVQIHTMQTEKPPFRLIAPGRVYRCDSDLTHTPMFHQVEGLMIDNTSNMAHLRGVLQGFLEDLFQRSITLRFRPSYFPFTEPSAEVDMDCTACKGKGCRICKHSGWLEVGGCGMVHPNVLEAVNISPLEYQGWAFGMGIDRLAMLYFGLDDLRMLFENDINFLKQFGNRLS